MKIGMNSQTLRFIFDSGNIIDYHIADGSTSSHFMRILSMNEHEVTKYREMISIYEHYTVDGKMIPMSWGSDTDKMTDITYTEVDGRHIRHQSQTYGYIPTITPRRTPPTPQQGSYDLPPNKPVFMRPPSPRKPPLEYTLSDENLTNFKKIFD